MTCILCLSSSDQLLKIFDQNGRNLNIADIITKHFWLKPDFELDNAKFICIPCWNTLESFHKFYQTIEEAHLKFTTLLKLSDKETYNVSTEFENFSDLFTTVVKEENSDETESTILKTVTQPIEEIKNVEKQTPKSESEPESESESVSDAKSKESSIKTRKRLQNNEESDESDSDNSSDCNDMDNHEKHDSNSDSESSCSDYNNPKKKKTKVKTKPSTESKHLMPCKDFDGYIKKNIELVCDICKKPLKNFSFLKEHFRKVHKTNGYINCCDKQFTSRFALVHHLVLHENPDMFKCPKCSRILADKRSYNYHMKVHDLEGKKTLHTCEKCKKSFPSLARLEKHLKVHSKYRGDTDQICDQCGKVYHSKQVLKVHQKRDHLGMARVKERVQCPKCGVYLSDVHTLKFHTKHLHPETKQVYACSICGKVSATGYGLKRHMQYMHTMERVHKCGICEDKAFKTAQRLREHMTTHTGEVLYTCPHCPKTFNSNANMHSHRKKMHRKEWEENRRHPHLGTSANAAANRQAMANQNASEDNNTQ